MSRWTLNQIPWDQFDPSKVDPKLLLLVKTASLVEYNSGDYTEYLGKVFSGDDEFKAKVEQWADEERQHGMALARWATKVDPSFSLDEAMERFRGSYRVPLNVTDSIRGSRGRELVARCLVESGTHSYYSALADASAEPVLKAICKWISTDEVHHYNLFYSYLQKYLDCEQLGKWSRAKVAWERTMESEDQELTTAFAAANYPDREIREEDFPEYNRRFLHLAYGLYKKTHMRKAVKLGLRAAGFSHTTWISDLICNGAYYYFRLRSRYLAS